MFKKCFWVFIFLLFSVNCWAETKITFAVDPTFPPMEFQDSDKKLVGYSIDFINKVGEAAGFTPVFVSVPWKDVFTGLDAEKYDAICSSVSVTPKRIKRMDFSLPYFYVKQAILTLPDSNVRELADLAGKEVGCKKATTGFKTVKKAKGLKVKSYDTFDGAMKAMTSGLVSAVVLDGPIASYYVNNDYKDKVKMAGLVPNNNYIEFYSIVVKKGNIETLSLINSGIAAVIESGENDKLQEKWIPRLQWK